MTHDRSDTRSPGVGSPARGSPGDPGIARRGRGDPFAQTLPPPGDLEAVGELVTEEMMVGTGTCGADSHHHLDMVGKHIDAGFGEIYVQQIGPDETFFEGWANNVLPELR